MDELLNLRPIDEIVFSIWVRYFVHKFAAHIMQPKETSVCRETITRQTTDLQTHSKEIKIYSICVDDNYGFIESNYSCVQNSPLQSHYSLPEGIKQGISCWITTGKLGI